MNYLWFAIKNLRYRRKRSLLTITGIFIGITAVVALISLGQGLDNAITAQFNKIGADKVFIQSKGQFAGTGGGDNANPLTTDDLETVRSVNGVIRAAGMNLRTAKIEVDDDIGYYFVTGMPNEDPESYELIRAIYTVDLLEGREIRSNDKNVVIVGYDYTRREVFENPVSIGDRIKINDEQFSVIGVQEAIGNPADDRTVLIPQKEIKRMYNITDEVYMIVAQLDLSEDLQLITSRIEKALLDERNLDEENKDFDISTPEELLESFGGVLTVVRVVLTGIALISLLVGSVNITNTMYTAVLERTREIGIMKAVGASPKTIKKIFLAESACLGLIGGAIGLLVGLGISKAVEISAKAALNTELLSAYVSWWLIIFSLLFSAVVGMIAGYFPARAAANQQAVESLRYE